MSLLSSIKKGVANSGSNKGKVIFVKADSKVRIRFLQEVEDGAEVIIHDHFDKGINALCLDHVDGDCPYCNDSELRTRQAYIWSVWDYDAKEVKLFMGFANNFNPLPSFIAMYEAYGTLKDRDYVIQRDGSGTNSKYSVIPMDKVKFKNPKAKPYTKEKLIDILSKAYPVNESDEVGKKNGKKKSKKKVEEEDDDEEEDENEYESMSPRDLYMECVERGLKAKKKQKSKYYIAMLEEDDKSSDKDDDWDEDEEEDEDGEW